MRAPETMLPDDQRAKFIKTYADAFRLGRQGRTTIGYVILDLGLDQAEQDRRGEAFWGEEVVGLYRDALRSYVDCFGIPEPWPPTKSEGTVDLIVAAILAGRLEATTLDCVPIQRSCNTWQEDAEESSHKTAR